jgi:asparagine synthetase B (glutamine-hydrolysing)
LNLLEGGQSGKWRVFSARRGPDSTGFAGYPNVLLARNRLSLIDYSDNGLMSLKSDYLYV